MLNPDWRDWFEERILERGEDYAGWAVSDLKITPTKITANVHGSHDYEVGISLDQGEVTSMYCTCPYADRDYCKHMAAVLYCIEEEETDEREEKIDAILDRLSLQELRDLIREITDDYPEALGRILARDREQER